MFPIMPTAINHAYFFDNLFYGFNENYLMSRVTYYWTIIFSSILLLLK